MCQAPLRNADAAASDEDPWRGTAIKERPAGNHYGLEAIYQRVAGARTEQRCRHIAYIYRYVCRVSIYTVSYYTTVSTLETRVERCPRLPHTFTVRIHQVYTAL